MIGFFLTIYLQFKVELLYMIVYDLTLEHFVVYDCCFFLTIYLQFKVELLYMIVYDLTLEHFVV